MHNTYISVVIKDGGMLSDRDTAERLKAAVSAPTAAPPSASTHFKPFSQEPQKQLRYEAYLQTKKQGTKGKPLFVL